ncbi:CRISPR system precrRNA processing endoribonuclease RAMP protein Cas6 [Armatimonas sp.]|uniref:CRISPR system precrRNA processing endoribonuclease RAMP protein Cas6 n=1 Tax=Armatimonas sp. TaxID=1872638 RepID=UPI0037533654
MPTLLRLTLELEEATFLASKQAPAQGWFLKLCQFYHPAVSEALHAEEPEEKNVRRPYTLSRFHTPPQQVNPLELYAVEQGLSATCDEGELRRGQRLSLRVGLLDDGFAESLRNALPNLPLPTVGRGRCALASPPEWLYAPWEALAQVPVPDRLRLEFATPTAFVSQDELLPRPEPERFLASWRRSWERFAPESVPAPTEELLAEAPPLVSAFDLKTLAWPSRQRTCVGFVGWMELTWRRGAPEEARRAAASLATLAAFCGTGAKTTTGLGQTRSSLLERR